MDKLRKALENLVKDLESRSTNGVVDCGNGVYIAAKEAIAQPEQEEPVAWMNGNTGRITRHKELPEKHCWESVTPLYTTPQSVRRLSDEDIDEVKGCLPATMMDIDENDIDRLISKVMDKCGLPQVGKQ